MYGTMRSVAWLSLALTAFLAGTGTDALGASLTVVSTEPEVQ